MIRFFFGVVLFLGVFIFPWWLVFLLGIAGAFWKKHFYELAFLGFSLDLLYAIPGREIWGVPYFLTWFGVLLFFCIEFFARERLRIYT